MYVALEAPRLCRSLGGVVGNQEATSLHLLLWSAVLIWSGAQSSVVSMSSFVWIVSCTDSLKQGCECAVTKGRQDSLLLREQSLASAGLER